MDRNLLPGDMNCKMRSQERALIADFLGICGSADSGSIPELLLSLSLRTSKADGYQCNKRRLRHHRFVFDATALARSESTL